MGNVLRRCALCGKFHASYLVVVQGEKRPYCYRCWKVASDREIARHAAAHEEETSRSTAQEQLLPGSVEEIPLPVKTRRKKTEPAVVVTVMDIEAGLRALGLRPGMGVIVHSSLRSFGRVQGGPAAVIRALKNVLTAEGTLLMPSFNHNAPFDEGGPGIYDPRETPTSNGAIPDAFWRMPGVLRSLDPTHPVAGWGKNARRYLEGHHRTLTMGPDSPLGLLGREGGCGLLLGVGFTANTFHHVVETSTGAPCLGLRSEAYPVRLPDGRVVTGRTWGWRETSCPINDPARYRDQMARLDSTRETRIGSCTALLFRLSDCFDVVAGLLGGGSGPFPPCRSCPTRPRQVQATVESDWDREHSCLRADSSAWQY